MSAAPPDYVIEAARDAGMRSPCAKSRRGVVIYNPERADQWERMPPSGFLNQDEATKTRAEHVLVAAGFNGPPRPWVCSGSDLCRRDCAELCLHAEERAIRAAGCLVELEMLALVHVKVVDGKVVAGKGPSCVSCSKIIADTDLKGIWLYELVDPPECPSATCLMCTGAFCNQCSNRKPADHRCEHAVDERHVGYTPITEDWRFYEPEAFHQATIKNLKLGDRR